MSPYERDRKLVKKWLGVDLTEGQFRRYSNDFTVDGIIDDIVKSNAPSEAWRFGTNVSPGIISRDIRSELLDALGDGGVIFNIEKKENSGLFDNLCSDIAASYSCGMWPCISVHYRKFPSLVRATMDMRSNKGLGKLEGRVL